MAAQLRSYEPADLDALYDICLKTGDAGADATALYAEPKLIGSIYSAPYGVLEPGLTILAEDEQGVAGYIVGTPDTRAFAARQERDWWPALRERHPGQRRRRRAGRRTSSASFRSIIRGCRRRISSKPIRRTST